MIVAFLLAGALAGLAGLLIAPQSPIGLEDGVLLGLKGMAAALLGRLGSLRLAIAGGLAIGALEGLILAAPSLGARWADVLVLALLAAAGGDAPAGRCWRDRRRPRPVPAWWPCSPSLPAVTLAGMPVLAQSAFVAVGGVGALQLERAGLPIGGAVLLAIALGGVAGALTGRSWSAAPSRRSSRSRRGRSPGSRTSRCSGSRRCPAARRA